MDRQTAIELLERGQRGVAKWNRRRRNGEPAPDLKGVNLRGADLGGVDFTACRLSGSDLSGANLREANLSQARIRDANLAGADLRGALLNGASLHGTVLENARLERAYLSGAILTDAGLKGADLSGANLQRCWLERTNLDNATVDGAIVSYMHVEALAGLPRPPESLQLDWEGDVVIRGEVARRFFPLAESFARHLLQAGSPSELRMLLERALTDTPEGARPRERDMRPFGPGDRLGSYEVVEALSSGSYSHNLKVRDPADRLYHAVVHKNPDMTAEVTLAGLRFESRLEHEGLPKIVHIGDPSVRTGGHVWFVREYLDRPLGDRVRKQNDVFPAREVLEIALGVCGLLEFLHASSSEHDQPIVHGFLFPGYIHRTKEGAVKVAGLDVQALVRSGAPVSLIHLRYRSPECLSLPPEELTPGNDVWALAGCMLYLATGQRPTVGASLEALSKAHADSMPLELARRVDDDVLRPILERAFAADPEHRFRDAASLRREIERHLPRSAETSPGFLHAVEYRYPHSIARPFSVLRRQARGTTPISQIANTLTATLQHVAFLALAEYLAGEERDRRLNDRLREAWARPLTAGAWQQILDAVASVNRVRESRCFVPELAERYFATHRRGETTLASMIVELVETRNELLKRRTDTPPTVEEAARFKRRLFDLLRNLSFLKDYPVVSVMRSETIGDVKSHVALLHMGYRDVFEETTVHCNLDLKKMQVAVLHPRDAEALYLSPFYSLRKCPEEGCGAVHLFRFNKLDKRRVEYVADGHRFKDPAAGELLATLLERPGSPALRQRARYLFFEPGKSRYRKRVGELVDSKYEIVEHIRRGGMADVYRVKDQSGQLHALKLLAFHFLSDITAVQRFSREARAAEKYVHPNITRVLGYGEDLEDHYIVLELAPGWKVAGGGLALDVGELQKPVPETVAVDIARQTCEGLAHVHRDRIVHRDVKPSNLLLFDEGVVKVADFGIARMTQEVTLTMTGLTMGTPEYMSPEQVEGEEDVTPVSDVYSVGVVMYEMLTGHSPFKRKTPLATMHAHVHEPPRSPRELNPVVSDAVQRIVLKCLEKKPADRFASASALFEALRGLGGSDR